MYALYGQSKWENKEHFKNDMLVNKMSAHVKIVDIHLCHFVNNNIHKYSIEFDYGSNNNTRTFTVYLRVNEYTYCKKNHTTSIDCGNKNKHKQVGMQC